MAEDGAWTFQLQFEATDPLGVYDVSATCFEARSRRPSSPTTTSSSFELTAAAHPGTDHAGTTRRGPPRRRSAATPSYTG